MLFRQILVLQDFVFDLPACPATSLDEVSTLDFRIVSLINEFGPTRTFYTSSDFLDSADNFLNGIAEQLDDGLSSDSEFLLFNAGRDLCSIAVMARLIDFYSTFVEFPSIVEGLASTKGVQSGRALTEAIRVVGGAYLFPIPFPTKRLEVDPSVTELNKQKSWPHMALQVGVEYVESTKPLPCLTNFQTRFGRHMRC